ncbi:hypothetical protein Tsubulata_013301 [Turnera subulata]|uniref:Uncharacterized protein n=1 Tax=Turnera subulata TaxID=218843 RepID=A0A9Q0G7Q9_9ROSI|nr:hypothetical protein Tsubulata_013301 [Turnera subulata]
MAFCNVLRVPLLFPVTTGDRDLHLPNVTHPGIKVVQTATVPLVDEGRNEFTKSGYWYLEGARLLVDNIFPNDQSLVTRSKQHKLRAPGASSASRRDTLLYLTAGTIGAFTIFSTEPAEAREGRLEGKKKVMEKLEKIREQAGVSLKPETKNTPPSKAQIKEKQPASLVPPIPFPNPQEGALGSFVEAIVP